MPPLSTKPYLVRALFEWCNDSGYTPHLSVAVGPGVRVPPEHVRDGGIVLNISPLATNHLVIGNEHIEFQARFSGVAREIHVPISAVVAVYARETGEGMAFPPGEEAVQEPGQAQAEGADAADADPHAYADAEAGAGSHHVSGTSEPTLVLLQSTHAPEPGDDDGPEDPTPAGPAGERPRLVRIK
jgi:stringent starvation protein B